MSVFKTKVPRKPHTVSGQADEYASGMSDPFHPKAGDTVHVALSAPEQVRLIDQKFPHYDALAVENLKNRR